jgi:hypothetical protein
MFAQNFFRDVSLDALGARIPRRDVAIAVEQKNGVIPYALNQQPEDLVDVAEICGKGSLSPPVRSGSQWIGAVLPLVTSHQR